MLFKLLRIASYGCLPWLGPMIYCSMQWQDPCLLIMSCRGLDGFLSHTLSMSGRRQSVYLLDFSSGFSWSIVVHHAQFFLGRRSIKAHSSTTTTNSPSDSCSSTTGFPCLFSILIHQLDAYWSYCLLFQCPSTGKV